MGICNYLRLKDVILDLSNDTDLIEWFKAVNQHYEDDELIKKLAPLELKNCKNVSTLDNYMVNKTFDVVLDYSDVENCKLNLVLSFKGSGRELEKFVLFLKDKIKSGSVYHKFDDVETRKVNYGLITESLEFVYYKNDELTDDEFDSLDFSLFEEE